MYLTLLTYVQLTSLLLATAGGGGSQANMFCNDSTAGGFIGGGALGIFGRSTGTVRAKHWSHYCSALDPLAWNIGSFRTLRAVGLLGSCI